MGNAIGRRVGRAWGSIADCAGTMCAIYREMSEGGYAYHKIWRNMPKWIRKFDIETMRQQRI